MSPKKLKPEKPVHHLTVEYGKFKMTGQGLGLVAIILIVIGLTVVGRLT